MSGTSTTRTEYGTERQVGDGAPVPPWTRRAAAEPVADRADGPGAPDGAALGIGEVAELTGLSHDTLRWYERIGLLPQAERSSTGQRRFSRRDLDWLDLVGRLRMTGMPVADMVRYAELVRAGDATVPERLGVMRATRERALERIAELHEAVRVLDRKIDHYEAGVRNLPEPLAGQVAGDRYADMGEAATAREDRSDTAPPA